MTVKLWKMTARSSRRNAPIQYQQLSFQCGRSKNSKINVKKQINNSSKLAQVQKRQKISNEVITNQFRNRKNNFINTFKEEPIIIKIHHETILNIITHLINHKTFVFIDQPGLRPTTNSQIRQMRQKLKATYKLQQFQLDINKIFRVFYQQTKSQNTIIEAVKSLQAQIKHQLNSKNQQYEKSVTSSQQQSVSFSKTNQKKSINKSSTDDKQSVNKVYKCKKIIQNIQQTSFEAETRPVEIKKAKRSGIIVPRPKFAKITLLQIATLGFNIRKLPSQQLALVCYKFCDQNQQKSDKIIYYNLQLQKMPKESLFELEAYVKNAYKRRNEKYQQVHLQDQYEDFVIQSDGQSTN